MDRESYRSWRVPLLSPWGTPLKVCQGVIPAYGQSDPSSRLLVVILLGRMAGQSG